MSVAETAWTTSETGAWSLYDGAETAARGIRDATDSTANGVFQGVLTAATAIWTTTESAAWSTEQSAVTLATATWTGSESVARSTEQSAVDTATQAQTTTTQGLQTQADQAWQTYLSSLAPGDPPAVTQQLLLNMAMSQPAQSAIVTTAMGQMSAFQAQLLGLSIQTAPPSTPGYLTNCPFPIVGLTPAGLTLAQTGNFNQIVAAQSLISHNRPHIVALYDGTDLGVEHTASGANFAASAAAISPNLRSRSGSKLHLL